MGKKGKFEKKKILFCREDKCQMFDEIRLGGRKSKKLKMKKKKKDFFEIFVILGWIIAEFRFHLVLAAVLKSFSF